MKRTILSIFALSAILLNLSAVNTDSLVYFYQTENRTLIVPVETLDSVCTKLSPNIVITPAEVSVREDQSVEVSAAWSGASDKTTISWGVMNSDNATVTGDGRAKVTVKGVSAGKTMLVASFGGLIRIVPMTVILRTTVQMSVEASLGGDILYVDDQLQFNGVLNQPATLQWDFGDGSAWGTGESLTHVYENPGEYTVVAHVDGYTYKKIINVQNITPISTPVYEGKEVIANETLVSFNTTLYNPDQKAETYKWIFPEGTVRSDSTPVTEFEGKDPGQVKFANSGTMRIKIASTLGGEALDTATVLVQVAGAEAGSTIYYVEVGGTIHAVKGRNAKNAEVYDLGVSSGKHMLNIIYSDSLVYLLDCGKQFLYVNDIDGNLGDGAITVMNVDGSNLQTVLSNFEGTAFKDPFYGYIEGDTLYFSDRNFGFRSMNKNIRDAKWTEAEFPSYVENTWLAYYSNNCSMIWGCFNACFGREDGVWWWCKKDNGAGMWRFTDADNYHQAANAKTVDQWPAAGQMFEGCNLTAYCHDTKNGFYYFAFYGDRQGVYRFTDAQCAPGNSIFHPDINSHLTEFKAGELKFQDGNTIKPIVEGSDMEGGVGEYVGVSQMVCDTATGDVYFGYRSSEDSIVSSGLIRYNAEKKYLEHVVKGVNVYGVAINPNPTKLF